MPVLKQVKARIEVARSRLKDAAERHELRHRPSGLGFACFDSIRMVRPDHWDALTQGSSVCLSRAFLEVLEAQAPENLRPRYAVIYQGERPLAALAAQNVTVKASSLSSGEKVRKGLAKSLQHGLEPVQRQILVCGNLLSWGAHGVAMAPDADPEAVWAGVAEALYRFRRADKLSGSPSIAMIKDLPHSDVRAEQVLRRFSYRAFGTEPNMVLPLRPQWTSFEAYLADMKSDYRSGIKKQLKDIEKADLELLSLDAAGVAAHAEEIYGLYRQVHDRQKLRLVTIAPGWIPALAARFGEDFRTSVLRPKGGGRLLGFITTLKDNEGAIGYYVGYDREAARTLPVYLRMLYRSVEDAIALRAQWVSLGRTALAPKAKLGALPQPTVCHLRHRVQAANLLVKGLLHVLPEPEDAPERNPFKPSTFV